MVRKRSEQDILNDFKSFINDPDNLPSLDLSGGNVSADFTESFSQELSESYNTMQSVEESISLQNAATIGADGMSQLGLNFFAPREEAVKAEGFITFRSNTPVLSPITIPLGTTVRTITDEDTNTFVRFLTTQEKVLGAGTALNRATGFYEVDVPVIAVVAGTAGNVGRNTVVLLETTIAGVNSITNKQNFTGGLDPETDVVYANRILTEKVAGQTIGTRTGYQTALISAFPGLTNVEVVGPSDPAMVRNVFGGAVDIYAAESNPQPFQDTLTYRFASTTTSLSTRPVISVSSVVGATTGVVFTQGVDWTFNKDSSAVYGGSIRSGDAIGWTGSSNQPGGTQTIIVSGLYDKLIVDGQDFLNAPTRKVPATDLLVKQAERIYVDITASVVAFAGYNRADVAARVKQAIIDGLSNYSLGDDVEQADLVNLIADVEGVNTVAIPFTVLKESTDSSGVSDITLTRRQLARANTPAIIITAT